MGRQYGSTAQSPLLATAAAQSSILPYLQSQLMTSPVLIRRTIVNRLFDRRGLAAVEAQGPGGGCEKSASFGTMASRAAGAAMTYTNCG
jgi:hypothetical protein